MTKTKTISQSSKLDNVKFKKVGQHVIADFWGAKNIPDTEEEIKALLVEAAHKANGTVLQTSLYKFQPQGVTGVVLLSESHISIHTWPEREYCSIDAFTCGDHTKPTEAIKFLEEVLKPEKVDSWNVARGGIE